MNDEPTTPCDLTPDEVEAVFAKLSPAERSNARVLYSKYLGGETQKWQEQKLYDWGIIKIGVEASAVAKPSDIICDTQQALAERMRLHYTNPDGSNQLGIDIDKGVVSDWCKLNRLDAGQHEPPGTISGKKRGKYSLKAWIEWFDKWMLLEKKAGGYRGASENRNPRQRIEDADARIREAKADRIEKENNEKYTLTDVAAKDGAGLGIAARNAAREVLENQLIPKVSCGLENFIADESTRAAFLEKLRRDGIELVSDFQRHYELCARGILEPENEPTN
jgi:hypothetical protein